MRRLTALALVPILALAACVPAAAEHRVALSLRDVDDGHALTAWPYAGDRYVAGEAGHRYAVELRNLTGRRQLVVVSVDGVNVVTGETAAPDQSGYVLEPWQRTEIRGWRKNLDEVASFRFAPLPASYAARTGRPDNVGVIGIAVFEERATRWFDRDEPAIARPRRGAPGAAAPAPAESRSREAGALGQSNADAAEKRQSLGTAHGERRYDPVGQTAFERASRKPAEVSRLFYDSERNLVMAGILPRREPRWAHRADPFPAGFVPDP